MCKFDIPVLEMKTMNIKTTKERKIYSNDDIKTRKKANRSFYSSNIFQKSFWIRLVCRRACWYVIITTVSQFLAAHWPRTYMRLSNTCHCVAEWYTVLDYDPKIVDLTVGTAIGQNVSQNGASLHPRAKWVPSLALDSVCLLWQSLPSGVIMWKRFEHCHMYKNILKLCF